MSIAIWYGKQELCSQALGGWDWDQKDNWPSRGIINNYSVRKEGSFYVFYCFLVFLYKRANLAYRDTFTCHSIVALFFKCKFNNSRMALEYTQKHTLFLLIKRHALWQSASYALIRSILFLKRTNSTQSVDKSPK